VTTATLPKTHECVLRLSSTDGQFFTVPEYAAIMRKEAQERKAERAARKAEAAQRLAKKGGWK
jgi:hypothetical protein